ncbi:MAG: hypothetical protein IRZ26_05250, partial [Clostridia bacterium]|nr:hypothetical protein [Clostridia bacterium]
VLGGAPGERAEALFRRAGAELIARGPDELLRLLRERTRPRGAAAWPPASDSL